MRGARVSEIDPSTGPLRAEAALLGHFILGLDIDPEFADRYAAAHAHLALLPGEPGEASVLAFALAHPGLLPCLDAAAALVRPQSLLHRKAILLAAILEASPRYADHFLPRTLNWPRLVALSAQVGLATVFQLAIGVPLLLIVGRRG